jgi:hypothetical protein
MQRHVGDGVEGRLVSMFTFDAPWDGWEVHPLGAEIVVCTAGEITLVLSAFAAHRNEVTTGYTAVEAKTIDARVA